MLRGFLIGEGIPALNGDVGVLRGELVTLVLRLGDEDRILEGRPFVAKTSVKSGNKKINSRSKPE